MLAKRHGAYALRYLAMDDLWLGGSEPPASSQEGLEEWCKRSRDMLSAAHLGKPGRVKKHALSAAKLLDEAREDIEGGELRRMMTLAARVHRHMEQRPHKLIDAIENMRKEIDNTTVRERRRNRREARDWLREAGRKEALLRSWRSGRRRRSK